METEEMSKALVLDYQQLDYSGHWKLSHLFSHFSDLATVHAEKMQVWHPEMIQNYGWVVSKMRIRIHRPLHYEDAVTIKTWPGKSSRVIFPRYFTVTDQQGMRCVEACSYWTLLDLKKRRITMPSRAGIVFPENINEEIPLTIERDFSTDGDFRFVEQRSVCYSDVDTNQHMNNARYIEWVCDALDYERFKDHFITDLSIYFKKETAPGAILTIEKKEEQDYFAVLGRIEDEVHFVVEGQWKKYS